MDVLGVDLSLTATGIASGSGTEVLKVKERGVERLDHISLHVVARARDAAVVMIEGYSFASKFKGEFLGELGGVVRVDLHRCGIPFVDVPPAVLKKYATGKGNASKDEMLATAIRRFGFEGHDNNEADAWLLRAMGLGRYAPEGELPAYQLEAIAKVSWPVLDGLGALSSA